MKIVTIGAQEMLMNRVQCMRDLLAVLDAQIETLEEQRDECCSSDSSEAP